MNVVELSQRLQHLQQQNDRLRQVVNTGRNSQSHRGTMNGQSYRGNVNINSQQYRGSVIDFETKYKKALKEIYEVIQANKSLKQELQKFKTSRSRIDGSMSDIRKQQVYKAYENVLGEKNVLNDRLMQIKNENEGYEMEMNELQGQMNALREENMRLMHQKESLQAKLQQGHDGSGKSEQLQQIKLRMREKEHEFHRTIQNYQQHHITLSNQNKKNQQRMTDLQQRLMQNDKQWRHRYQAKQIQFKEIKNNVRHQYQQQINILRREINSLKLLNTELMTKLQTIELQGHTDNTMTEYEIQIVNSIKQLRLQMEPLKKQIIQLQEQNHFDKEQLQRQKTQLQLKLYQHDSTIQHYTITIKNQQDKLNKLNDSLKKYTANQVTIKKLEDQNKILAGKVIVLESKDITLQNRKDNGYRKLQENVLEFQTRVEMLLNEKENLSNVKNVSIHQLVSLKAYIAEMDMKLRNVLEENEYATKKYKSYKEKYLNTLKEMKTHEATENTLKSKILGYDKLVQRLQSQLQKNVNISEMEVIEMTSKTTQEQVQLETFKKKYQSLKQKLVLQQKYNKQELQTIKLNYETKIVDMTIKVQEINSLKMSIQLYKDKNEELQSILSRKDNEILQIRMSLSKNYPTKTESELNSNNQNREFILSLQETIRKQQTHISKVQSELRLQQDASRKRILTLQRELHQTQGEFNKAKLSTSSTRHSNDKSSQQAVLTQNKRLRNRVSELQNEMILAKGKVTEQTSKNTYQLEFKASSLQIQRNELNNRLETELSNRKRVEKQLNELMMRNNELQAETAQLSIQNNRKVQQLTYQLNEKLGIVDNLQEEIRRLKVQQRKASVQIIPITPKREDHSICENKITRLQRELQNTRVDNEQLRKKINESAVGSLPFSYQIQSLKHQKQQYRLKTQRLQKQIASNKSTINSLQQEKYQTNKVINTLKQQISSIKLTHQDSLFDQQRLIAQLKTKLEHNENAQNNYLQVQTQLQFTLGQKDRQISNLRSRLNAAQSDIQRMNDAISKYTRQINSIKYNNESTHQIYTQQMESLLQEKTKTLKKYQQQITILHQQINTISSELSTKTETLINTQRELTEYQLLHDQLNRLTNSLSDRENVISKNRYEISTYEEENQRVKRQLSTLKEQIQRQRLEMLQKEDQVSSLRLQMSTLSNRLSNQIKGEFIDQLGEKEHQVSKLNFQLQSLQNSYNNLQEELNETQGRERKCQQQLSFARNQLSRSESEMSELSQKLMRKQGQMSQLANEVNSLKYLQQQVGEKNLLISKLRGQVSSIRIQLMQISEQVQYKQSTILRQGDQLRGLREQVLNRDEVMGVKEGEMRNIMMDMQRLRDQIQDMQMAMQQKDNSISKLTVQITKSKQQKKQYQQEIQQREHQWSNIQYELNQAKSQINQISDQIQAKDIFITKLSNQTAFMRQQITRLNEEIINKNHQINKVSQQVFLSKMDYTNKTSQQVQTLSNQLYSVKRLLQLTKHTAEDLQGENRRLRIQLQGSRIKTVDQQSQHNLYIYTQQDLNQLKEQINYLRQDNNNKYRQIMELHLEINQRNSEINLLHQKTQKLQHLLHQLEEENHYNKQHLEEQIQHFIQNQKQLRYKFQSLQSNSTTTQQMTLSSSQEHNTEELKFGLKLYTEETDRLKNIIEELTEEVNALRLKLTVYTNQQDRINQNLGTLVMTFAQVEALRDRMKNKQEEINSVRRSFIQAVSSNQDLNSQYKFNSSNLLNNNKEQKIQTFDVLSQHSHSLINYKSQKQQQNITNIQQQFVGNNQQQQVKEIHEYEVRSDQGSQQIPQNENVQNQLADVRSLDGDNTHQQLQNMKQSQHFEPQTKQIHHTQLQHEVNLPEPIQLQEQESSHAIEELNKLREESLREEHIVQEQHVTFRPTIIQQPQQQQIETVHHVHQEYQQISTSQQHQRGRNINIVYQGTQVQGNTSVERQRISQSQYQSPSGNTYVRITQQQRTMVPVSSGPGVYVPQETNIQPVRQSGASFSNQPRPVTGSFQNQPHNLRY